MKRFLKNINPFLFNGGICRIGLLLTLAGIFVTGFLLLSAAFYISENLSPNLMAMKIYMGFSMIVIIYTTVLAYMKRLHDIIDSKGKSIFYIIALFVALTCLETFNISIFGFALNKVVASLAILSLVLIPGKKKESC